MRYFSAKSEPPPENTPVLIQIRGQATEERAKLVDGVWLSADGMLFIMDPVAAWRPAPGTKLDRKMRAQQGA